MELKDIVFQLTQFDFRLDLNDLQMRYQTDAQRIEAAFMASKKKALEYMARTLSNPADVVGVLNEALKFEQASQKLLAEAATISGSLAKFQFPKDLWGSKYKDPFKDWRLKVKAWATTWDLDPTFRALL